MEKKKIIIIAVIAIIAIIAAGVLILNNTNITLEGMGATVTVPHNYTLDKTGVASAGDKRVTFIGSTGGLGSDVEKYFSAVEKNGKSAGYDNYKTGNIGDFKYYEFSANPKELKNVSTEKVTTGATTEWTEYPPEMATGSIGNLTGVAKMRKITFINTKDNSVNELILFSNSTDADLYSAEMEAIINSITPTQK